MIEFRLPSHNDGILLQCRIEHPQRHHAGFGAVFAHPYGPLGGSFSDPIVHLVKQELLSAGAIVATFNFRGSGESQGKSTWSAGPETADFETVLLFLWHYICQLAKPVNDHASIRIVLGGYSFGSLVASRVHYHDIIALASGQNVNGHMRTIIDAAIDQARELRLKSLLKTNDRDSQPDTSPRLEDDGSLATFSFLLVSPLPGLVGRLIAPLSRYSFLRDQWQDEKISCCPSVAIFGDEDQFSRVKTLRSWALNMQSKPGSNFKFSELTDVDHFYGGQGASAQLREKLQTHIPYLRG